MQLVTELVIPKESVSIWLWEAKHEMSDISKISGMDVKVGEKRHHPLPEYLNTVEKRRQARRNQFIALLDSKVVEGRLLYVCQSSLGYALTYYHTIDGNMYKK